MKIIRKQEIETEEFQIGDQLTIALDGKDYTATVQQIMEKGAVVMFDDYVARREMNKGWTNKGGFDASDLNKWMQEILLPMFPEELRPRIKNLAIPSVGQMFGHDDEWCKETFEADTDEQFPLMKIRKNRIAFFENRWGWGWLKNATKKSVSSGGFARVDGYGNSLYDHAAFVYGVRPVFLLVRSES